MEYLEFLKKKIKVAESFGFDYERSNLPECLFDPFGGIMSTPYVALKMKRKALAIELNQNYWKDGISNIKAIEDLNNQLSLF